MLTKEIIYKINAKGIELDRERKYPNLISINPNKVKKMVKMHTISDPALYIRGNPADLVISLREKIFELNNRSILLQLVHDANVDTFYVLMTNASKQYYRMFMKKTKATDFYRKVFFGLLKVVNNAHKRKITSIDKEDLRLAKKIDKSLGANQFQQQYARDLARVRATKERLRRRRELLNRTRMNAKPVLKREFYNCTEKNGKVIQFHSKIYKVCDMTYKLVIEGDHKLNKVFRTESDAVQYINTYSNQIKYGYL